MDTRATRPVVDPRTSLALWLRAGRAERKLTLDDVARVTKIQPRILEKLETGQLEGLPAEVFVRGFVKSFARCVGLDEGEAAERYGACAGVAATPATTAARAFVETLVAAPAREGTHDRRAAAGTPSVALPVVAQPEPIDTLDTQLVDTLDTQLVDTQIVDAPIAPAITTTNTPPIALQAVDEIPPKRKRAPRKKASTTGAPTTRSRKKKPTADVIDAVAAASSIEMPAADLAMGSLEMPATSSLEMLATTELATCEPSASPSSSESPTRTSTTLPSCSATELATTEIANVATAEPTTTTSHVHVHVIEVIDQSTPVALDETELALGSVPVSAFEMPVWQPTMPPITVTPSVPWKRPSTSVTSTAYVAPSLVIDDSDPDLADLEREEREASAKAGPHRVSFLPPILLDRDDKSGRQGGLTLAVIILLIAATLTLSYLMRRPSVSGDGVTMAVATSTSIA